MPNRAADTVFWSFGATGSLWFMICVVYRIGGETRAEYFAGGIFGAALLWGCGWLARACLSGQPRRWLSTAYDAESLAPSRGGADRLRGKRSAKRIANRANPVSHAKRHRRR